MDLIKSVSLHHHCLDCIRVARERERERRRDAIYGEEYWNNIIADTPPGINFLSTFKEFSITLIGLLIYGEEYWINIIEN